MNKERIFAVGDIHGQITMIEKMLKYWDPAEEQLLFLGDLADRGENSKATLELAHNLVTEHQAIVIKGNHDEMLERFLENPAEHVMLYYMNGGGKTVNSLLGREAPQQQYEENVQEIKEKYPWLLPFLKSLRLYYEWENYLFVHAGVNLQKDNWKDSSDQDFVWIREGFYDQSNHTDKIIIFGHTVTAMLNKGLDNFNLWKSGDGLIGIDGGAVYGGKLHALVLSKNGIEEHYVVENEGYRF